ncbi:hypothetical protein L6164_030590 [Bauhinia variegata]|uniref:Uncharacterized protein n=1 Tax=Bauhinia variegata TaxID=167791 RepID=A0ACB9LD86_BAUVA|nr:hypothetical protein L6164_030590 [Bauhinia variegata]
MAFIADTLPNYFDITYSAVVHITINSHKFKFSPSAEYSFMANDAALRSSLLLLAAIILVVGICTQSVKKMITTYVLGVLGIVGILLPDWDYFNRDFSRWGYPVTAEERASLSPHGSGFLRFADSPLRLVAYTAIYGYAVYKWWDYVSSQ